MSTVTERQLKGHMPGFHNSHGKSQVFRVSILVYCILTVSFRVLEL